ncbi:MAG: hypothetical protein HOE90_09220 [Bacteriovoracaceae bacterium]|jgi:hypothetical protein|nr:hypothetical protein [Bacteriovoracaceae bacterium]
MRIAILLLCTMMALPAFSSDTKGHFNLKKVSGKLATPKLVTKWALKSPMGTTTLINVVGSTMDFNIDDIENPKCGKKPGDKCTADAKKSYSVVTLGFCEKTMPYACQGIEAGKTYDLSKGQTPFPSFSLIHSKDGCNLKVYTLHPDQEERAGKVKVTKFIDTVALEFTGVELVIVDMKNAKWNPDKMKMEYPLLDSVKFDGDLEADLLVSRSCK